jgi:putative ABC transport system substrate-binding protein
MTIGIGRRHFISALGGVAVSWPLTVRAQQPAMPLIGFLNSASPGPYASYVTAFRRGLNETGFSEGRNVAIEYRWAEGQYDRLPQLAADLVHRQVAVIAATGGGLSAVAAKASTTTIPIVFATGTDPVQQGLVASLNRPGGNVTGVFVLLSALEGKRLGLLREMVPTATLIAVLLNPANSSFDAQLNDIQEAARSVGQQLHILYASSEHEIDAAFATAAQLPARAMLVGADPVFSDLRDQLIALAARYAVPAIFELREFAAAGGLMSYGSNLSDAYRLVGLYSGQILKGTKPADLPVQQSTKFELVINLKTAKVLGINVPPTLLARADEVIE